MKKVVKIQYINKDQRNQASKNLPEWKKKINEINLEFSDLISKMYDIFPHATSVINNAGIDFGTPNDYAKLEIYYKHKIQYSELHRDYFHIDTQTLEITDPEVPSFITDPESPSFTGCTETEWYNKYENNMDGKLY